MFEAMICSSSRLLPRRLLSAAIRLKTLRRGRIALTTSSLPSATQSPTAGKSERASAVNRNEPETLADRSPSPAPSRTIGGLTMDGDDPGRADALGRERREGGLPVQVPAEGLERGPVEHHRQPTRFSLPVRLA